MRALILLLLAAVAINAEDDRAIYFADPAKPGAHVPITRAVPFNYVPTYGAVVGLRLEIRTKSVEDQNTFARMVIGDSRSESTYYYDKDARNVSVEVTDAGGKALPARVYSRGGGENLEYFDAHVGLEIGGDPARLERETGEIFQQMRAKTLSVDEGVARMQQLKRKLGPNTPGTYQVRAIYRPKVPGKWIGELATPPITIVIREAE